MPDMKTSLNNNTIVEEDLTKDPESLLSTSSIPQTSRQTGTVLANQNTVAVSDMSRLRDRADLTEVNWNYKSVTSKPYIIKTFKWLASQAIGTSVFKLSLPRDYFYANSVLLAVADTFTAFRGDIRFYITVQSTPNVSGGLILSTNYQPDLQYPTMHTPFLRQHLVIDASNNSFTGEIVVPFRSDRNSIEFYDTAYDLEALVLAPLQGLSEVAITVAASLEDQEFRFLRPKLNFRKTQGLINVAVTNNNLSHIESATIPTNITGDELDTQVSMMDDVGLPTNPPPFIITFNSLNNTDNPHKVDKMVLNSSAVQVSTADTFNTKIDEMDINYINRERDHYVETFKITPDMPANTVLSNLPLVPTPIVSVVGSEGTDPISLLELNAYQAKYWRGGLKYKFKFFMNRFQSIRVYVALFYNINFADPNIIDYSSSHGVMVDIGGDRREFEIEVPFNSVTPWLNVPKDSFRKLSLALSGAETFTGSDFSLGQLAVYAVSPLVSSEGDLNPVYMVTTMSGAKDFELATFMPTPGNGTYIVTAPAVKTVQGLMLAEESKRTEDYQNDLIVSYKQLSKKWACLGELSVPNTLNDFWVFPVNYFNYLGTVPPEVYEVSSYRLISSLFTGYRGSIKLRIQVACDNPQNLRLFYLNPNSVAASAAPVWNAFTPTILNTMNYEVTPINYNGNVVTYEVEVPFQRNRKWYRTNLFDRLGETLSSWGYLMMFKSEPGTITYEKFDAPYTINVWGKIGDDGRFGILNGIYVTVREALGSLITTTWDPAIL